MREIGLDLKRAAYHLKVIMPEAAKKIEGVFDKKIGALEKPLFPRIND